MTPARSSYATRQRELDYLQLHWLEKTTGRPSHDWDIYLVKELLDNALDADERWLAESDGQLELAIELTYRLDEDGEHGALSISVANRAPFPLDLIPRIFSLTEYTSDKSHYNYPNRGHQGNALKTLLGIPYALRHFTYGDYRQVLKPVAIQVGTEEHALALDIDEQRQRTRLLLDPPGRRQVDGPGTTIRVNADRFRQERRRTFGELETWAKRFALFNPHVAFRWRVELDGQECTWAYPADPTWRGRFAGTPSIHWYEYGQLRELLLALEREYGPSAPLARTLARLAIAGFGPGYDPGDERAEAVCAELGISTLGDLRLETEHGRTLRDGLLPILRRESPPVPPDQLGALGEQHLSASLTGLLGLETAPLYRRVLSDDPADPAHPFVLELALGRLPAGARRVIWTGLNHTPTYEDPFFTRWLYPATTGPEPVYGLDGVLDAYGQTAASPIVLVLHLICPNLAFQEFSKTAIDPRPFRGPLAAALDEMLTALTTTPVRELEDLEADVHAEIQTAVRDLCPTGRQRFATGQLIRSVRPRLNQRLRTSGRDNLAEDWLADPAANNRLLAYIQTYARDHPHELENLIQPERGRLSIPTRPHGSTALPLSQVDARVLDEAGVDKILLITDPDLEEVVVANELLARFDVAVLRSDGGLEPAFERLLPYLDRLDLPLAVLHHATPMDCLLAERLRARLVESGRAEQRLYDLGLTPSQGLRLGLPPERGVAGGDRAALAHVLEAEEVTLLVDRAEQFSLLALSSDQLLSWMEERFAAVGLTPKHLPSAARLRATALGIMKRTLGDLVLARLLEGTRVDFVADRVMQFLQDELQVDDLDDELADAMQKAPFGVWPSVLADLVSERCRKALATHEARVDRLIQGMTAVMPAPGQADGAIRSTS